MSQEPSAVAPESIFQAAVVSVCRDLLRASGRQYVMLESFGLDIAMFITEGADTVVRLVEVKVYASGRPGGVGFGNQKGQGPQVDLLLSAASDLKPLKRTIAWAYADATRPIGSARYALCEPLVVQSAAMGNVARGKQNNIRVSALQDHLVMWPLFFDRLSSFLQ